MIDATSNFVLPAALAERYRVYANAIYGAISSERPEAFTTCARLVAGMVSKDFPLQEAVDRLWATAEAAGIVREYGEDLVQARLAEALNSPIVNEDVSDAEISETDKWNDPDWSILDDRRGELPEFPLDTLPAALKSWIERSAHGAGVTSAHVGVP